MVCGMMTSMCVDATVRRGRPRLHRHGGARRLRDDAAVFGGVDVPAPSVHAAFLAALADGYASVVPTADLA